MSGRATVFVVQRYGAEIDGGSETLCREIAERLARVHELEVWTTTARDYLTWAEAYPAGTSEERGVRVRRFPVASRRRVRSFGRLSERLYRTPHSLEDEIDWMVRQGPRTPELLAALREERDRARAFVFFTYLYYPTAFGLPLVCEKSVLVPTVHDEPPARFALFHPLFHLPRALVWQTAEEQATAERLFRVASGTGEVAGFGIETIDASRSAFRARHGLGDYLLYLGRIDVWKGIPELLARFARVRAADPTIELVLAGSERMRIPRAEGVRFVGYLGDAEKREALAGAVATVVPSAFESLSIVALESFAAATPILANAASDVLRGQCARSGGGLVYASDEEFAAAVTRLRSPEGRAIGERGRRFVESEASWTRVLEVYRRAIERAASAG